MVAWLVSSCELAVFSRGLVNVTCATFERARMAAKAKGANERTDPLQCRRRFRRRRLIVQLVCCNAGNACLAGRHRMKTRRDAIQNLMKMREREGGRNLPSDNGLRYGLESLYISGMTNVQEHNIFNQESF